MNSPLWEPCAPADELSCRFERWLSLNGRPTGRSELTLSADPCCLTQNLSACAKFYSTRKAPVARAYR